MKWVRLDEDNVDEFDVYERNRLVVAGRDVFGEMHYNTVNEMHASLTTIAKMGGMYILVIPELVESE